MRGSLGAAGAVAIALAICGWRLGPGDPASDAIEARLYDLRMLARGDLGAPPSVAVVAIDEAAVADIGMGAPMRLALAEAVRRLRAAGAAAIAIDLLLVDPTPADAALARTLAARDDVILAVAALPGPPDGHSRDVEFDRALRRSAFAVVSDRSPSPRAAGARVAIAGPTAMLAASASLGHVNVARAPDRVLRRLPLAIDVGDGVALPALPLAAARIALQRPGAALRLARGEGVSLDGRFIATDRRGEVLIDHPGRAGTVEQVTLAALLDGAHHADAFRGRAVFIGATAETLGDVDATPLDPDVPGVESLAATAAQIIEGRSLNEGPFARIATIALAALAAVAMRAAALVRAPGLAGAASVAVCVASVVGVVVIFSAVRLALDATAVLGATIAVGALGWFVGRSRERRNALADANARAQLQQHVSPLVARSEALGVDADRPRLAAVVFVDMIGSTAMAEKIGADAAGRALAAAQRRIGHAAARWRGDVVEVIGDGALVAFGFGDDPGHAARDALDFVRELATPADGAALRATAHYGAIAIADLGFEGWRRLSIAGDAVNVASRMQDVARACGAPFLASAEVVKAAGGAVDFHSLAEVRLSGRTEAISVLVLAAPCDVATTK